MLIFIAALSSRYYLNLTTKRNGETILSNWELREDKIREFISFFDLIVNQDDQNKKTLNKKAKKAHCGRIFRGDKYYRIEYINEDILGIQFFYIVLDKPVADSFVKASNSPCVYRYYKPDVVLEMHSGVLGAECWSDYLRNMNNKHDQ